MTLLNNVIYSYQHHEESSSLVKKSALVINQAEIAHQKLLAQNGDPKAYYLLACCGQAQTLEVACSKQDIFNWYSKAAQGGIREAYYKLGRILEHEKHFQEALDYYVKGSEKDDICCLYRIALFYERNIGLRNPVELVDRFERAAFYYQEIIRQELVKQLSFDEQHRKAEHYCTVNAFYKMGLLCEQRKLRGFPYALAEAYYIKAIKLNPNHAETYCGLGRIAEEKRDYALARNSYLAAVSLNYNEAHYHLAQLYYIQENYKDAYVQALQAAHANHADACSLVAELLEAGKGCTANRQEAFKWYSQGIERASSRTLKRLEEKATNDNDSQAQYLLGRYTLQRGNQDTSTIERGLSWYKQAALNHYWEALNALEMWYEKNQQIPTIELFLLYLALGKQGYGRADYKAAEIQRCGYICSLHESSSIIKAYEQARNCYEEALKAQTWWPGEINNDEVEAARKGLQEVTSILEELKEFKLPDFTNRLYLQIQEQLLSSQHNYPPSIFYWVGVLADIVRLRYTQELQNAFCSLTVPLIRQLFIQNAHGHQEACVCFKKLFTLFSTSTFTEKQLDASAELQRIELLQKLFSQLQGH